MSDSTSAARQTPQHTPNPSATFYSGSDGLEVQFHPLILEEFKEDASTTFAQDPLHSNRDSERKSLQMDSEKQGHVFTTQLSTQPPVTARWPGEVLQDMGELHRDFPELEGNDTDEGLREEAKEATAESRRSEHDASPKSDQATLARRPRTAEISGHPFEDLAREEEKAEAAEPMQPIEEAKQSVILFPNSPFNLETNVALISPDASPISLSPLIMHDDPGNESDNQQPLLVDQEGSSDPTPPPQPPPMSPFPEEEKYEFYHSEQHSHHSPRLAVFSPFSLVDELSEDESHPRPTDSIANEPQQADVQLIEVVIPPHREEAPLQAFHRPPSSDDAHSFHHVNSEEVAQDFEAAPLRSRVSYWQCFAAFKNSDLSSYLPAPGTKRPKTCWESLFTCCITALPETKERDCNMLLALAKRPMDSQDIDTNLLFSLWSFHFPEEPFVGESQMWTDIGFSGSNPSTEASTLELLQLLFLASEQPATATTLLAFSRKRGATFNYALECVALTQLSIRVLASGRLDGLLSSESSVTASFNAFFLGCLRKWFSEFQRSPSHVDWSALEARVRSRPKEVLLSAKCTLGA